VPADAAYLACDLGASSGRLMLATIAGGELRLDEIARFASGCVELCGTMRWDPLAIWSELRSGLAKAARLGASPRSLSVDAWAVDYVLVAQGEPVLSPPFHYRDARCGRGAALIDARLPRQRRYQATGIQSMPINTINQLAAESAERPELLALADGFLMVADHLHFLLTGVPVVEASNASTTQLFDPVTRAWRDDLIAESSLPKRIFPRVVPSGTVLGPLKGEVAERSGLGLLEVVTTCSHDTGAAVAAAPGEGSGWAYISSGTWSLVGIELSAPLISAAGCARNLSNELGWGGSVRFLRNVSGLWLLQECRRAWAAEGADLSYERIIAMAESAPPLAAHIDPEDARFADPGAMPARITDFCHETGQPAPRTRGAVARVALESLALAYRRALDDIEEVAGVRIQRVHVVGGGSRNHLLNQFTADATGREVIAGPVEATAMGNALMQAIAAGRVRDLAEARHLVRASTRLEAVAPRSSSAWERAYHRFRRLGAPRTAAAATR
jgi:rhamnulokinase